MDENMMPNEPDMQREKRSCKGTVYVIKEGDTLYKIARKYHLRVFDLMIANPFVNVYNLQIGEELCIPAITQNDENMPYVTKEGDTIGMLLDRFGVTFEQMAEKNPFMYRLQLPTNTVLVIPKGNK